MEQLRYTTTDAETIKESLTAPHVSASLSTLGGADRASVIILVSLDQKETWAGGYLENSRYVRFALHGGENRVECFTKSYKIPHTFRKAKIKSVADAVVKIQNWIDKSI